MTLIRFAGRLCRNQQDRFREEVEWNDPHECETFHLWVDELNNCPSSADDCKDENDQCNNKQNVDIRAQYVEADEAQQPQDQKNYKDGPQHSNRLLTVEASTCDKLRLSGKRVAAGREFFT
jgi:hypothetical protein